MGRTTANMQKLLDLRERQVSEIQDLQRKLDAAKERLSGIEASIVALGGEIPVEGISGQKSARRNVKKTVMAIVQEAGPAGVTASEVMDRAAAQGRELEKGSVSSLLSRFKRDGALTFDGERYRAASERRPVN